jgi:hypothetical protein
MTMMKHQDRYDNLDMLGEELERKLTLLRYSRESITKHLSVFKALKRYLKDYGASRFSEESGRRFLSEYLLTPGNPVSYFRQAGVVVRRLCEIVDERPFVPRFIERKSSCPEQFSDVLEEFLGHAGSSGRSKGTLVNYRNHATRLLG